ncbi:MAG: hypothetical protein OXN25_09250 [Candidatus Poribacteria bacterium]|nr:hypothetical protein [Candidatus Poribacteria bacterium]
MAADIKAMVEKISKLTVLELCKLIKALKDKFGLRTSGIVRGNTNEVTEVEAVVEESEDAKPEKESKRAPIEVPTENVPVDGPVDEPKDEKESEPVPDPSSAEVPDAGEDPADKIEDESENKKESEPVPDPSSAEVPNASDEPEDKPNDEKKVETDQKETIKVKPGFNPDLTNYDSNWTPTNPKSNNSSSPPPPMPKGEDYDLVYAWRYSDNKKFAKIGESTKHLLHTRMPVTYYPTGDPVLIGIRKCKHKAHAIAVQNYILDGLGRTLPRREWVKIDEVFNEMIDKSFISDPDELKRIFGRNMKTEKIV